MSEPSGRPIDFSQIRTPKEIGEAIDILRKECRPQLANNRLAKKAGVQSATTITNWINGVLPQKRENLHKLLTALKTHPAEIDQIMAAFDALAETRRQQRLINTPDQQTGATHLQEDHAKISNNPDHLLALSRRTSHQIPLVLVAILTIVAFGFGALTATVVHNMTSSASVASTSSDRSSAPALPPVPNGVCAGEDGTSISIQNHHSGLYINNDDRPRMGTATSATNISVMDKLSSTSTSLSARCPVSFRANSSDHKGVCMDVQGGGSGSDVVWRTCSSQSNQAWTRERHWNDGDVVWERFHPLLDYGRCLAQAKADGGSGTILIVEPCSADWRQQWLVERR